MNHLRTWCSSLLLVAIIFFQPACTKRTLGPESQLDKLSQTEHSVDDIIKDPFSQDPPPETTKSQDHSIRMLRDTVIPLVDWPKQLLSERLKVIEKEAAKVGVSVQISEALRKQMVTKVYPELRIRKIPLATAIQFTIDSTNLRSEISKSGVLLFLLATEVTSDERNFGKPPIDNGDP